MHGFRSQRAIEGSRLRPGVEAARFFHVTGFSDFLESRPSIPRKLVQLYLAAGMNVELRQGRQEWHVGFRL